MAIVHKEYMQTPTASQTITFNGTYDVTEKASAVVNVPTPEPDLVDVTITENGTYTHSGHDGYDEVTVNVPPTGPRMVSYALSSALVINVPTPLMESHVKEEE